MTDTSKKQQEGKAAQTAAKPKKDDKADRLAEALRANLRKRKAASKKMQED